MSRARDPARRLFHPSVQDSERACFEAGIALAVAYHYLLGAPIPKSREARRMLERGLSEALAMQPFREKVEVRIAPPPKRRGVYSYPYITPQNFTVRVVVKYGGCRVFSSLRWSRKLKYPLMLIDGIERG